MTSTLKLFAFALAASLATPATAQTYPDRPVRIIVPFAPGGGTDHAARFVAKKLEEQLKQPVLVENRPGAAGAIGSMAAAKSPADGYTLLLNANGFTPTFYKNVPFDFAKELTPVSLFYRIGWFLFVNPALPARSVSELVAHAKANPGKLNYGYASPQPLLLSEAFIKRAGIDVVKVSYKGDAAISQALVAGEVQIALATLSSYRGLVDGGKVRVLATTGQARSPIFPDVPTLQELGFNNFIISAGNGFWVPSGTPAPIITRLSRELASVAAQADTKEFFRNASSAETVGSTPEEFAANTTREQAFYAEAAKAANYQPEQ